MANCFCSSCPYKLEAEVLQSRLFQQGYSLLVMSRGIFVLQWQRAGQEKRECKALLNSNPLDMGETSASSAALELIAMRRIAEYFVFFGT